MGIISWIIFGLIVGAIANLIDQRPSKGGILGSLVLGIVGAVIGGFLGNLLLGIEVTGFNITSLIIGVIGAMIALGVGRTINRTA